MTLELVNGIKYGFARTCAIYNCSEKPTHSVERYDQTIVAYCEPHALMKMLSKSPVPMLRTEDAEAEMW